MKDGIKIYLPHLLCGLKRFVEAFGNCSTESEGFSKNLAAIKSIAAATSKGTSLKPAMNSIITEFPLIMTYRKQKKSKNRGL